MKYETYSHRHAIKILEEECFQKEWKELKDVLDSITDNDIITQFPRSTNRMSISAAINDLIRKRLVEKGWKKEPAIFNNSKYTNKRWRLDFAKKDIAVEVAFNHGEAMAWNLLKPAVASELNHIKKAIQTQVGVIILAKDSMKKAGAFDGAVGSYEKALRYLDPMRNFLTAPMVLIGLEAPKTFKVSKKKEGKINLGKIIIT